MTTLYLLRSQSRSAMSIACISSNVAGNSRAGLHLLIDAYLSTARHPRRLNNNIAPVAFSMLFALNSSGVESWFGAYSDYCEIRLVSHETA
jgi:hypothetical protein